MPAELLRRGIVPLRGIAEAFDAAEAAAFIGEAWARRRSVRTPRAQASRHEDADGRDRQGERLAQRCTPDEAEAKALLAEAGLAGARPGRRAANAGEAVAAAGGARLSGRAEGARHRPQVRARRRPAQSAATQAAVRDAADALVGLGTGLYVERMVAGGVAELIVGVTRDPMFGPVMTIGSGGVLVELLQDTRDAAAAGDAAPTSRRRCAGLKLFPLLDGYRGRPKADLDGGDRRDHRALPRSLRANAGAIEELDINPLIVCAEGQGAWIADALLVRRGSGMSSEQ